MDTAIEKLKGRELGVAVAESRIGSEAWKQLDALDVKLGQMEQPEFRLRHFFTPTGVDGKFVYTRELTMPKNAFLTSAIHLLEHPFIISQGLCLVWDDESRWVALRAPHLGITKPGTRRALFIVEETVWTTTHITSTDDPEAAIKEITYDHAKLGHISFDPAEFHRRASQ
jgi:hypothetical protein